MQATSSVLGLPAPTFPGMNVVIACYPGIGRSAATPEQGLLYFGDGKLYGAHALILYCAMPEAP